MVSFWKASMQLWSFAVERYRKFTLLHKSYKIIDLGLLIGLF